MKSILRIVFIVTLSLSIFSGCSEADAKPSKEKVSEAFTKAFADGSQGITEEEAKCLTNGIYDEFSAAELNAIVNMDKNSAMSSIVSGEKHNLYLDTAGKCIG